MWTARQPADTAARIASGSTARPTHRLASWSPSATRTAPVRTSGRGAQLDAGYVGTRVPFDRHKLWTAKELREAGPVEGWS